MDLGNAPAAGTILLIVVTALITGAISSMLFGVFGKKIAEALLEMFLRPIRFTAEKLYRWIAPRNPFSISLRSYKRHVSRSHLTLIENPVGPSLPVPLEHAFAPLKLISSGTKETIDLFAHTATVYRCIVLGGPGTGKTTLMKSLVTSIIKGRSHESLNDLIPVFVVLRNLAKSQHTVEQAIVSAFANHHFPGASEFVNAALSQGKMLIILDGLDEVGANREFVAGEILRFCEYDDQRQHRNRLIVTCRESSYRTKDLQSAIAEIVRVEPFANHHMRVFLQGWPLYRGRLAIQLYGLIQSDRQIRDICRNPLLLTILTGLYLDADNFELPTSRDRFYKEAVDELLSERPARRQIKQNYRADDKRRILERVALERLETVGRDQDPEEFTREAIQQTAREVLGQDKFDVQALITELVEINGIIKQSSEGNYTCAHRTIQEYFAASDARRTRKAEEVITHFGSRPELIEVVYFYCGLIENIPDLTFIITTFVNEEKWLEAGRCLLQIREPLAWRLSEQVAVGLRKRIQPGVDYQPAMEVLSSLAQRHEPQYASARELFSEAIDYLMVGYGEQGASALESVLATSPEAAMKVIPGLLRHSSQRWKIAAIQLLRDIGTDEALDQLVQLLRDDDPFVRTEAAKVLAGMMKSRNYDLRLRATFLPEQKDPIIWPLEPYFPGSLAIPIAQSLDINIETGNVAIQYAVKARHANNNGASRDERSFLKQWRHVARDLALQRKMHFAGRFLYLSSLYCLYGLVFVFTALGFLSYFRGEWYMLTTNPFQVYVLAPIPIKEKAESIIHTIEGRFPPNASGISRLLPWNWEVEPVIPEDKLTIFNKVKGWSNNRFDPYEAITNSSKLEELSDISSKTEVIELQTITNALEKNLPNESNHIFIQAPDPVYLVLLIIGVFISYLSLYLTTRGRRQWLVAKSSSRMINISSYMIEVIYPLMTLTVPIPVILSILQVTGFLIWAIVTIIILIMLIGGFCERLRWPSNPLILALDDVVPRKELAEESGKARLAT